MYNIQERKAFQRHFTFKKVGCNPVQPWLWKSNRLNFLQRLDDTQHTAKLMTVVKDVVLYVITLS